MAIIQSSIEAADRAQKRVFVVSIVFGVVAALVAAFLAWLVWNANNKYQDAVKADADARIAEAATEVARLRIVVANAERSRLEAEKTLLQLQEQVKNRHVTLEQRETLLRTLQVANKPEGHLMVVSPAENEEARGYALEFGRILLDADCFPPLSKLPADHRVVFTRFLEDVPTGLRIIEQQGRKKLSPFGQLLYSALIKARLDVKVEFSGNVGQQFPVTEQSTFLLVGRKPE